MKCGGVMSRVKYLQAEVRVKKGAVMPHIHESGRVMSHMKESCHM